VILATKWKNSSYIEANQKFTAKYKKNINTYENLSATTI